MPLYRFDDFELDADLYRLSRGGEPIAIGPKPFDLLLYLISHTRRTISKAELIREVWQAEVVSDSSIPTCVTALRRALSDDPNSPRYIQTIRGRGYRFIASAVVGAGNQIDSDQQSAATSKAKTFVGRESEMASLTTGLSQALSGDPRTFLLLGEAGMGKTRLIEEFHHVAIDHGATVLVGRCREEEGAPAFWPWIQILRTHIESGCRETLSSLEPHAAVISQMLPEISTIFPSITPLLDVEAEQARFRLLDAVTRFLQASAKQKPLVLMIDDLHRADTSSLILLEFLVRDLRRSPILILGAYRVLDIIGDTVREQCLKRVARAETARSIQLNGISQSAVGELVGQPENAELVSALYEQSAGNPFFLTQLIHLIEVDPVKSTNKSADHWRFSLPFGIKDAIASQLVGLPIKTQEALTIAAVLGRNFSAEILARGLNIPFPETLERLEPAILGRLIENTDHPPGTYRFSHALLRDVTYDQIPMPVRSRLHKQIGEILETLHESDLEACIAELAYHFRESADVGDAGKAIAYCIAAGEQAAFRLAHENAPEHFQSALRLMDLQEIADPRKRCELLIQLGAAEMRIGEREAARHDLLHAANIARQIDAPELLARAALGLAPGFFTIEVGSYDPELESLLNEARSILPKTHSNLLVQLTARLAMAAVWSNTTESCYELSAAAVTLASDTQNPVTKAYALRARHGALWGPDRFDERRQLIFELGELARISGDAEIALMYRILNITAQLECGDISATDREILAYTKLAESLQLPHAKWYVSLFAAMRALMEGRFSDNASLAQCFLEIGDRVHDQNAPQSFGAHLLLRLWEGDNLSAASPLLDEFIAKHPLIAAWKCVASFFYSENNELEGARIFDSFAELGFDSIPLDETWATAIQMLTGTCCNIGDSKRAEELYDLFLPGKMHHTIVGYGVMSFGSRARELGNLAGLMGRFEDAEEHFELAITQNQKTGATPWVAHSQFDFARMLSGQRNPARKERTRELVAEAQQTADLLGMARLKVQIADFVKDF